MSYIFSIPVLFVPFYPYISMLPTWPRHTDIVALHKSFKYSTYLFIAPQICCFVIIKVTSILTKMSSEDPLSQFLQVVRAELICGNINNLYACWLCRELTFKNTAMVTISRHTLKLKPS
jgi:hypothetical protein